MNTFESNAYQAVLEAVEKEEGRMAPKKRLAVLAALDCFAEFGFDGTSTKMIAQRAGIGEATIFRHFPSKKALLLRIAAPVIRHILAPGAGRQAQELLKIYAGDPRKILREVMLSRLHFMTTYEPLVKILFQEALVNADLRAMVQQAVGPLLGQLSEVTQLVGLSSDADRERFFRLVASTLAGYFLHRSVVAPDRDWDDEAEVDTMVELLFAGLAATR